MKRVCMLVVAVLFLFPAVSWSAAFTIDASIVIDASNNAGSGVFGTINPIIDAQGAFTTAGTFDFSTQDILLVEIVLTAGALDQFGIGGAGVFAQGGGFLPGSGTQDPNDSDEPIITITSSAVFNFDHLGGGSGNLTAGESSGILAASFALGDLPPIGIGPAQILADMASFMLSSGANFSVQGLVVPVPEPGTALLVGLGIASLAATRRR